MQSLDDRPISQLAANRPVPNHPAKDDDAEDVIEHGRAISD